MRKKTEEKESESGSGMVMARNKVITSGSE